ncbi:MAG TPA: GntR family transcriptional regulator [Terriglobia bacterium]|nr:GntR family transcriptional regulator [Terriglobia bacterium]
MAVNRTIDIPLYAQVREALREDLARLEPGQAIPPEIELQTRFDVSRITVRKAMDDLVTEGLLVRQQGRGTFVQRPKLTHELNMITSWTEQLLAAGFVSRTVHLETEEIVPPKRIAISLDLGPEEPVLALRRVRMVSEEPLTLMLNYLPSRLVPGLGEKMARRESLYEVLEKDYGLVAARAIDLVETRTATDEEAKRLRIEHWAPLLCVTRVSYLEDGRPLEVGLAISRGDRYRYRVELRGRARIDPAAKPASD